MGLKYFSQLPIIEYPLNDTTNKKARDILHRLFLDQRFLDQSEYVKKYRVGDGDRPEIISEKLYQRPDIYSIIMLLNDFDTSLLSGLPPNSSIYEEYLKEKYSEDVYYVVPVASLNLLTGADNDGYSGDYIHPIFGYGFNVGDKIFGQDSQKQHIVDTRAYVREWDPILCSLKLQILSGSFDKGLTITNGVDGGSAFFKIAHKKSGLEALHHFETIKTTYDGTPKIKGSFVDPLSRVYTSGGGKTATYIPIGVTAQAPSGALGTGSYGFANIYRYNIGEGSMDNHPGREFIRPVTNKEYEERLQERKREIKVPSQESQLLRDVIDTVTELLESTNTG